MKISKTGKGSPLVGIVGCLHGDEPIGKDVIELLKQIPLKKGTVFFVLANEKAIAEKKRFIDTDLNRSFPGNEKGNHEERLAFLLKKELTDCDFVIDIHSTEAETEPFIIKTKTDTATEELAEAIPVDRVVIMSPVLAHGKALIDHVGCGISLEFCQKTPSDYVKILVEQVMINLGLIRGTKKTVSQENFEVYGILKKEEYCGVMENFTEMLHNNERFFPLFYGSKTYKEIACLKARKVK